MTLALALPLMLAISSAPSSGFPRQGWLLGQWPEAEPVQVDGLSLLELDAKRTQLKSELRSYAPAVAMIVPGAVLTPVGAVTALVGLLLAGVLFSSSTSLGVGLLIAGGAVCLGGLVLLIAGLVVRGRVAEDNQSTERALEAVEQRIEEKQRTPPSPVAPEVPQVIRDCPSRHAAQPA